MGGLGGLLGLGMLGGCKEKGERVLGRPGGDLLSRGLSQSTIGAEEFNGRVRNGIGWGLLAKATRPAKHALFVKLVSVGSSGAMAGLSVYRDPPMADGHWVMRAIKPIERLVHVSSTHCCASTSCLSTSSSTTALKGELVSRWVSRLDAFSGYPVRT